MTQTPVLLEKDPNNPKAQYVRRSYLSYSSLMSFARCPRRYFYQKSGLAPYDEGPALSYGTAMHKAVDIAVTEGLDAAMAAFESLWDEGLADEKRNLKRAKAQIGHYLHTHQGGRSIYKILPAPDVGLPPDPERSKFEIPFVVDVGLPVPIAGYIDGWGTHRDTGEFWAREFKTTSRLTAQLLDGLELNPQILTYALILQTVTARPIRGVMWEAMLIDKTKVDNITHPIPIEEHQLAHALTWLKWQGSMLLECEERQEFPKNFAGCSPYPMFYTPGFTCDFHNLCRVPNWRQLEDMFQVKPDHRPVDLTIGLTNGPRSSS